MEEGDSGGELSTKMFRGGSSPSYPATEFRPTLNLTIAARRCAGLLMVAAAGRGGGRRTVVVVAPPAAPTLINCGGETCQCNDGSATSAGDLTGGGADVLQMIPGRRNFGDTQLSSRLLPLSLSSLSNTTNVCRGVPTDRAPPAPMPCVGRHDRCPAANRDAGNGGNMQAISGGGS
jgi:hypothetical protein